MNKSKIKPASRKALIAANKNYYSWSTEQQEKFRATMDETAQNKVESVILNSLFGFKSTVKNASEICNDLPISKTNDFNWAKLLTAGIGEDFIFLNECMADNVSLLNFNSLYDYDYDDYLFQEQANKKEFKNYKPKDYYAFGFSRWARLIINDQFYYATLHSLAGYLIDEIEDKSHDYIEQLIPHEYVEGKENGKQVKGGFCWDMRIEANGLEKQLDELKSRWYRYTQQRWIELSKEFTQNSPAVFIEDINVDGELNRNYIFNNEKTLKKIRWKYFLADCEPLIEKLSRVTERAKQEVTRTNNYLQKEHEDIMKNFDPKVVKLKRKMKIVVAPGALDDLVKDDADNDPTE